MRTKFVFPLCSFVVLAVIGCGSGEDDPLARNNPRDISQVPGGPVIDMGLGNGTEPAINPGEQPAAPSSEEDPGDSNPSAANKLEEATADTVGTKGKNYGGGIITEPIHQYFRIQDRLKLQQLEHAVKLYYAEHGRYPATMEQYVEEIARPNQVPLPELPPGRKYFYDAQQGKLFVQSE